MKKILLTVGIMLCCISVQSQTPELIYYNFSKGTTVDNLATSPVGTNPVTVPGGLSVCCNGFKGSNALSGNGAGSSGNVVNTGWNTLIRGSFTVAFYISAVDSLSTTPYYLFGDAGANGFACSIDGKKGMLTLHGPFGGAVVDGLDDGQPHMIHLVYDSILNQLDKFVDGYKQFPSAHYSYPQFNITGSGLTIGGYSTNNGLKGIIDEFRWYNRALSGSEIAATWDQHLAEQGNCQVFSNVESDSVNTNGIEVTWTPGSGNTSFYLEYGPRGFTQGNGTTITGTYSGTQPPVYINGLNPDTEYDIYLGEICNSGVDSVYFSDPVLVKKTAAICFPVNSIALNSVTTSSATLDIGAPENFFDYEIGPTGFTPGTGTTGSGGTPLTISGLNAQTDYDVYVRSNCTANGKGVSSVWAGPFQFRTLCTSPGPVTLPFVEDFEGATGTYVGNTPAAHCRPEVNWSFETDQPNYGRLRFDRFSNNGSKGATMDVDVPDRAVNNLIGTINMSNYDTSSANFILLKFSHVSHGDDPGPEDSVWIRGSHTDPWIGVYDLYANQMNGTYVQAQDINLKYILKNADQNFSSTFQLRFGQADNGLASSPAGNDGRTFDDIVIEEVSCFDPTGFAVDTLTSNSATLSFDAVGDDYEVEIGPCGFMQGMGTLSTGTEPLTVTGLNSGTCYEVYFRRICGGAWIGPFQMRTPCAAPGPVTLPLAEGFEGASGTFIGNTPSAYCRPGVIWSFETNQPDHGRLRFDSFFNNGSKGATLDRNMAGHPQSGNFLIGTINMSNYDTSSANFFVLSFFHNSHGNGLLSADNVWVRGSDTDPWIVIPDQFADQIHGTFVENKNIRLKNILKSANQNFSSTFQLRFGQRGSSTAASLSGADGRTFDDILIEEVSCLEPTGFTASNITDTSATLVFDNTGDNYEVEVGSCGFTQGMGSLSSGTEPLTVTGLIPDACYDVYVRIDCGIKGFSNWAGPYQFSTSCTTPSPVTLPFTEDFEGASGTFIENKPNAYCRSEVNWSFETNVPDYGRLRFSNFSNNGSKGATLDRTTGGIPQPENYLIGTINMSNYDTSSANFFVLSFFHNSHGEDAHPLDSVWIRGSHTDPWIGVYDLFANQVDGTFIQAQDIELKNILKGSNQNFSTTFQLRFGQQDFSRATSLTSWSGRTFDDILIEEVSCLDTTGFATSNVTATSANLTFDNIGDDYEVDYGLCGFIQGTGTLSSGTEPLTITGLNSGTCYDVYVRKDCGSGSFSSWVGPFQFHTPCTAPVAVTLPFTEDFEGASGTYIGSNPGVYCRPEVSWSFETNQPAYGRLRFDKFTHTGTKGATLDRNSAGNPLAANYLVGTINMSNYDTSSVNFILLSFFQNDHFDDFHPKDSVWIRGSDTDHWIGIYDLFANQKSTFTQARYIHLKDTLKAAHQNFSSTFQLRFGQEGDHAASSLSGMEGRTFDDILIEEVSCLDPIGFVASNVTATSASLTFDNTGDDYEVEYGLCGFTQGSGMAASGTEPISLSGLNAASCYDVYVRRDCGSGDFSGWTGPFQFQTPCTAPVAVTLPFVEDFEGASGTYIGSIPGVHCRAEVSWSFETNRSDEGRLSFDPYYTMMSKGAILDAKSEGSPHRLSENYLTGTINMSNYDTSSVNFFHLSFFHRSFYNDPALTDSVWIRGSDTDPWIGVYDLLANQVNNVYVHAQYIDLNDILKSASQNFSSTFQLRFEQKGYLPYVTLGLTNGRAFDDILIEEVNCMDTIGYTAGNITANGAMVTFNNTVDNFEVEAGTCGYTPGTGTAFTGTGSISVTGLMPDTCYDIYVRRDCGVRGFSDWVGPYTFTTLCDTIVAPYREDFENFTLGFFDGNENCLNISSDDPGITNTGYSWEVRNTASPGSGTGPDRDNTLAPATGGKFVTVDANGSGAGDETSLLTPMLDITGLSTPELGYYYHMYGTQMADLHVDIWDGSQWLPDQHLITGAQNTSSSDPYNDTTLDLSTYNTDAIQIRFRVSSNGCCNGDVAIDDIRIDGQPICPDPSNLGATNITASSADLFWTGGGAADWNVEYGLSGFSSGSGTYLSSTNDTLMVTGLTPGTQYDFYVRDSCGMGDVSFWVGPFSFSTLPVPGAVTLPITLNFGGASGTYTGNTPNVYSNSEAIWSFVTNQSYGRIAFGTFTYNGTNGVTLDAVSDGQPEASNEPLNYLIGSIDMSDYDTSAAHFYVLSFYHNSHGDEIHPADSVWIRGSVNDPWIGVYDLFANQVNGTFVHAQNIDLKNILRAADQNFSSTFQLRFGQQDNTAATSLTGVDGRTFNDIMIGEVSCLEPVHFTTDTLTSSGATLSFDGFGDNYEAEVGICGFTPGSGNVFTGANTVSVTGLTGNTCYEVYVRRDCGTGGFSNWVGPYIFTTLCNAIAAPYLEDFESFTIGRYDGIGDCWSFQSNNAGTSPSEGFSWEVRNTPQTTTTGTGPDVDHTLYPNSGGKWIHSDNSGGASGDSTMLISPMVDISALTSPELKYHFHNFASATSNFRQPLYVDIFDGVTWNNKVHEIDSIFQSAATDPWKDTIIDLSPYSANGLVQVRFRTKITRSADGSGDIAIDDVSIYNSLCTAPTALDTANVNCTSADLIWSSPAGKQSLVEYGPAGFTLGTGTKVNYIASPYTLSGISPNTSHDFYVADTCGNDTSAWVMSSFTTASEPIAAVFTFNSGNPTTTDLTLTFDASSSVGATNYSWDFDDGSSGGTGMNTTHTYTTNGTYYVTLTVTGPCGTATFSDSVTVAGISLKENTISSLSIYPNPTSGTLDVSFDTEGSETATLAITDLTGKVIFQIEAGNLNGHYDDQLDISKLARGTYMLRIESGYLIAVKRIIKQ